MIEKILRTLKKIIPTKIYTFFQPAYHYTLALLGALIYRFPARKLHVIGVTGTKGKSSVTEIMNTILEEAGYTTALSNTIRFKIGNESKDNMYKMSMPGRMVTQRFLRSAVKAGCTHVVLEITSQGALLFRNKWIDLDALIFTNLAPEHIEAHGSYENYRDTKVAIAKALETSNKPHTVLVVNGDDKEAPHFLALKPHEKRIYSLEQATPFIVKETGFSFTYEGITIHSRLSGEFNIYNIVSAITYARTLGISIEIIKRAIEKFSGIRGRVEYIEAGQDFKVIVDYAHTPDSLQKLYDVFQNTRRICVLGNTGGGRDIWKRDEMAKIAENSCDEVILTNEDPYDDDPQKIIEDMAGAMTRKPHIIMDRREAISYALSLAKTGDSVLITGKGTDPYIMGPNGSKIPWSDAKVAKEELEKIVKR